MFVSRSYVFIRVGNSQIAKMRKLVKMMTEKDRIQTLDEATIVSAFAIASS